MPANKKSFTYAVLDIETNELGKATDFGIFDGERYYYTDSVTQAVEYILSLDVSAVYAHYGLNFDFAIIYRTLLTKVSTVDISLAGSQAVFITIKYKKKTIFLLDSFRLMPASLAKLSKQFGTEVLKQNLEGVMPWNLTEEERYSYLKDDCYSLYQVIQSFWNQIDINFGMSKNGQPYRTKTLASLTLKIFIDQYTRKGKVYNPDKTQAALEECSYFGGLIYVNTDLSVLKDNVSVYDVNSMYPYVMQSTLFPYSYHRSEVSKFTPKAKVALWVFDYEFFGGIPFIFDILSRTMSYTGRCMIDTDTANYILSQGGHLRFISGHVYERTSYMFKEYIDKCYTLRQQYGNDSAMGYVAKILMNSLYGKFGEKSLKRSMSTSLPKGVEDYVIHTTEGIRSMELFDYTSDRYIQHRFPAIASLVTLRARLLLKKAADKQGDNFLYCDTDCIHVIGEPQGIVISNKLGDFKLEHSNIQAIYKGKKAYQIYKDGCIIKTVLKGIPHAAREGMDFRDLTNKEELVNYVGFSSLTGIATNREKEFRVIDKVRTVRDNDSRLY